MIAIIDYGAGNLFSVQNALEYLGERCIITRDQQEIERADSYILPGVGAFPFAMQRLTQTALIQPLKAQLDKKPLLGICLGMQMLFDTGYEFEETKGLSLIPGTVQPIPDTGLKIPHMGWNALHIHQTDHPLLQGISDGDCVYFVHSYQAVTEAPFLAATVDYGNPVPALTTNGHIFGAQFHPEKSGEVGLQLLKNFGGLTK